MRHAIGAFEVERQKKTPGPRRLGRYTRYHLLFLSQRPKQGWREAWRAIIVVTPGRTA
jgi:hypothetical protein